MKHNEMSNPDFGNGIIGQEKAKVILRNIFTSRRVPHAFLFFGPEGTGKFFTALEYLKLINSGLEGESAQKQKKVLASLSEPALKLIFPLPRGKSETGDDSAYDKLPQDVIETITEQIGLLASNPYHKITVPGANTIKISSIRDIKKFTTFSNETGFKKGVIILDADEMADEAQNALLKSLEEPPEDVIFFLITSNKEKLLPTIHSRCWQVKFNPLSNDEVKLILIKHFGIEESKARLLASFSDGSLKNAIDLMKYDLDNILLTAVQTIRFSLARKFYLANKVIEEGIDLSDKDNVRFFISAILKWLKDVNKHKYTSEIDSFGDFKDTIEKFNQKFSNSDLASAILKIEQFAKLIDNNLNLNIILLGIIFELSALSIRK